MPDGAPGLRAGVCLLSAEDGLADTIRPRLLAAGADLARVRALTAVHEPGRGGGRPPVLPRDLPLLEDIVAQTQSRLPVIDPSGPNCRQSALSAAAATLPAPVISSAARCLTSWDDGR
jgi:hypothetical protein